jgi:O-antigen/teichoic acid export membrane protein
MARSANSIKLVILSRLLAPHDFGLMGIANTILKGFDYLSEVGLNGALIKKSGDIRPYFDTTWTLQILRCSAVATILFFGAPFGAHMFQSEEATPIIRAIALVAFFRGFVNPAMVGVRKELDFQRQVMWRVCGVGVGLIVAIVLGFLYRNVWALVASVIAAQATWTLLSFWIERYVPHIHINWTQARELMQFGKWLFWLTTLNYLSLYIDSIAVGRVFGVTPLGFYQMAQQLAMLPTVQLGSILRGVMFPAFSKLQSPREFRRAFLQAISVIASVVLPLGCFLTVFAEPLILVILGERWVSIVPAFRILTWAGVAAAMIEVTSPVLLAMNRPDLPVWTSLLKVLGLLGLLYVWMTPFGVSGVASAVTVMTIATIGLQLFFILNLAHLTLFEVLRTFKVGLCGAIPFLGAGLVTPQTLSFSLFFIAGGAVIISALILVGGLRSQLGMRIGLSSLSRP